MVIGVLTFSALQAKGSSITHAALVQQALPVWLIKIQKAMTPPAMPPSVVQTKKCLVMSVCHALVAKPGTMGTMPQVLDIQLWSHNYFEP